MTSKEKFNKGWEVNCLKFLTDKKIDEALEKIGPGLIKYSCIQDMFKKVDVSQNEEFQRKFNGFYRVQKKPKAWYESFYFQMKKSRKGSINFLDALSEMYKNTRPHHIEASFVSKMLATIDPKRPVIDKYVLLCFDLRLPSNYKRKDVSVRQFQMDRIKLTVGVYNDLVARYKKLLKFKLGKKICNKFDKKYPESKGISDLKKVDFVLWQIRPDQKARIY